MRAPGFWFNLPDRPGPVARMLAPLGWVYATGTALRLRRPGYLPQVPVICVGNLVAGGAGKTPTVIALIERLSARGHAVHVVSRGYGGQTVGPERVTTLHRADAVGDEPLLLSAFAPVWVARDRAAGVRAAEAAGARVILLDDGFQSPAVQASLRLLVVDAARGFGNGRCIPAGPLREPVAVGLQRADLVLTIGEPDAQVRFDAIWGRSITVPRSHGRLSPVQMGIDWKGERVLAFAGIADPDRFFATLRQEGANVIRGEALADHAPLSETLLRRLEAEAASAGAQLVTTEKDAARLPSAWRAKVLTLVVRLQIQDWTAIDAALDRIRL
jgi:tetraacyldisaccharide 4'-kinase